MDLLGNVIWFCCGGWIVGTAWIIAGALWCITVAGIPVGLQCFKIAGLVYLPFGREIEYVDDTARWTINLIWIATTGVILTLVSVIVGAIMCATILGIPFGMQFFKIAKIATMPLRTKIH